MWLDKSYLTDFVPNRLIIWRKCDLSRPGQAFAKIFLESGRSWVAWLRSLAQNVWRKAVTPDKLRIRPAPGGCNTTKGAGAGLASYGVCSVMDQRAPSRRVVFGKAIQTNLGQTNMSRIYKVIRIRVSFEKAFECVSDVTNYHSNRTSPR